MPTFTKNLGLTKPDENDFYNQQTEQCENWDKLDEWSEEVDKKTVGATSSVPGIVKYGTDSSTALEGHRMAQSLGVGKFGGDVQTAGTKKVGYAYWCTVNKDMYVCKVENSLNYIDAAYFEAFSNNALLGKLNNLTSRKVIFNGIYELSIAPFIFEKDFNYSFIEISVFYSLDFTNEINTIRMPMENNHQALPVFFSGGLASICRVTGNQIYTWDLKNAYLKSVIFVNV